MMVIKQDVWDGISRKDRVVIDKLVKQLEPEFWAVSARDDQRKLQILEANGIKVIKPDAQLREDLRAVSRQMWREFITRVPESEAVLDTYLQMTGRPPLDKKKEE